MLLGTVVKPFKAQAYHNGKFIEVTEADFKGRWSVICFYPADFSKVCPTELEDLQDHYPAFKALGVEVYSVSTDTHFVHKAWHENSEAIGKVTYPMIGDPAHILSKNFEILGEDGGLANRGTFIIDPDGVIQAIEINARGMARDASILIHKIKAAQFIRNNPGESCPAKWGREGATPKASLDLAGKI